MKTVGILVCMMLTGRVLFAQTAAPNDTAQTNNTYVGVSGFNFFFASDWTFHVMPEFTVQRNRMFYSGALMFRVGNASSYASLYRGNRADIGGAIGSAV